MTATMAQNTIGRTAWYVMPCERLLHHGSRLSIHERMRHDLAWGSLLWKPRWRYWAADGWAKKKTLPERKRGFIGIRRLGCAAAFGRF
jgi:hypothetical protein